MRKLSFDADPAPLAPWIPSAFLGFTLVGFIVAVAIGSWWNVATFALLIVTASTLLLHALRVRRTRS